MIDTVNDTLRWIHWYTFFFCDDQVNDSIVTIAVFIYYCNLQRSLTV